MNHILLDLRVLNPNPVKPDFKGWSKRDDV
jgi:hypothetical protein